MARRRGRRSSFRSTVVGILILAIGGMGVWFGARWVEEGGIDVFRSLERSGAVEEEGPEAYRPDVRVRVEVLNAGGVPGMASTAKDELRDLGFDVVYFGNAATFDAEESEVIDRGTDPEMAFRVAGALGIPLVRFDPDSTLLVDVTVRLGSGWRTREERSALRGDEGLPEG